MKRSSRGPGGPSGLVAGLILVLATVLATALAAGCGPAASTGQSAPPTGQPHDHSASPAPSESCGGGSASAGGAGASPRQPVLSAVQFVSASVGWVVGSDRIMHTADGGRHWTVQFRTSQAAQLGTVDFIDASDGWVTGASEVLATTDGGAHWRALPEPCRAIRTVHFVSPDGDFAVAGGNLPYVGVSSPPLAGGMLLRTTDGGQHWQPVATPPGVQSVCFSGTRRGWLGAEGNIYGTVNGGRSWTLAVRGPIQAGGPPGYHALAEVECAGSGAGWAELNGPGAALSHMPQIGYHTYGRTWQPIFAEQYTASPALRARVPAPSPGVYPGPFSAISPDQAVFIGSCPPCSAPASPRLLGPVPMDVALHGGAVLLRRGRIGQLSQATGAAFVTASDGWVTGIRQAGKTVSVIMHTADGGRSWRAQYVLRG
jgi:Photosynthesis system II assembly factor YCF48